MAYIPFPIVTGILPGGGGIDTFDVVIASSAAPENDDESGFFQFPFACTVEWVRVTAKTPGGTTTAMTRRNSGATDVQALTLGAADTSQQVTLSGVSTTPDEKWDCKFTAVGDHTDVVVMARATAV